MFIFFTFISCYLLGQQKPTKSQLEEGYNFIETQVYSEEENQRLIKLYEDLRVSDVTDGMDAVGLPYQGLVDVEINPQWVDHSPEKAHAFSGIAVTTRYVPTQRSFREADKFEDYSSYVGHFYSNYSPEAFTDVLFEGAVLVRDDVVGNEASGIGSNNILNWASKGMVGVVTDGAARDVDEIALQEIPLYNRTKGRGVRPGRSELESVNRPVEIGGVLVCPGDVMVADGDGVIVVPRRVAKEVAEYAHNVIEGDKAGRRKLYEELGIPLDETVK